MPFFASGVNNSNSVPFCFSDAVSILTNCEEFLSKHGSILHSHNVYVMQLNDYLMDACINTQRWDEACVYAATNTEPYR